jgi:hypothetical protein
VRKKTQHPKKVLRRAVNPVYITSIDEIDSSHFFRNHFESSRTRQHWNHRESKPDLTEHSTRIGPGVRARLVLWWSQPDDVQDAFAAELPSRDPGQLVAWTAV